MQGDIFLSLNSNPKGNTTDSHDNFVVAQPLVNYFIRRGKSLDAKQKID